MNEKERICEKHTGSVHYKTDKCRARDDWSGILKMNEENMKVATGKKLDNFCRLLE